MSRIAIDVRKLADFGIGTYVRGLVRGLSEIDVDHEYLLIGDPASVALLPDLPPSFRWVAERARGYSVRELWSVSAAVRRERADLYHAPHYVLPFRLGCPAVVTIHDLIHLRFAEQRRAIELLYARRMVARSLRHAAAVLAVSETTRDELVDHFGAAAEGIEVIPNGVDERFRGLLDDAAVDAGLARLGLDRGYLLFVGNPKPHKNLGRLLEAQSRLARRDPETPFLVIAGGAAAAPGADAAVPSALRIARRAAEQAAPSRVAYLGRVADEDLAALYRGALALVVPSLWEGFGLPAVEAASTGTPVVAAARGALPEVLGDAALYVDPESVEDIESGLERILRDAELRAELAQRGPERAARFDWRRTAASTLAVYRRLLGEPAGSTA